MPKSLQLIATVLLLCFSYCASAENLNKCFIGAANTYHIDRALLLSIARHESKLDPYAMHHNNDGTYDYGIMQINSTHLPLLRKAGIQSKDIFDGCTNIYVGAWVLHSFINKYGATWRAVGAYNAGTRPSKNAEENRKKYVAQIKIQYEKLRKLPKTQEASAS